MKKIRWLVQITRLYLDSGECLQKEFWSFTIDNDMETLLQELEKRGIILDELLAKGGSLRIDPQIIPEGENNTSEMSNSSNKEDD